MKPQLSTIAFLISFSQLCLVLPTASSQDEVTELISRLNAKQFDQSVLVRLERHRPDPRIVPALAATFHHLQAKTEKQEIAVTLIRLGEKSDDYFEFLAAYVREAVEDRTPACLKYDSNGKEIRGEFSPEFLNWCASNGKDARSAAALQLGTYPRDTWALVRTGDSRAKELFRKGLDSPYGIVVGLCVQGLGRLQDVEAIPLIEKASQRLPHAATAIAMALPWFQRGEADALMARLEPDQKSREYHKNAVQRLRAAEVEVLLKREGTVPDR